MGNGAASHMKVIPHSRPTLGEDEIAGVSTVIRSARIGQGKIVEQFEKEMAQRLGGGHSAACGSGTAALHLALRAMHIGRGDEVILPSFVCSALLHAVNYVSAKPVFAEIDPVTCNIDPMDVKNRITRRTKAVIVPHLFGLSADLSSLSALGVPLIEDCAQAVGAAYGGKPLGAFGSVGVFSFYATKVMTTGEGGMVVSKSKEVINTVKELREYDKKQAYQVRYNYKMTDMQAEMGRIQLRRLDCFIQRRRKLAEQYRGGLEPIAFRLPPDHSEHIYYRYVVTVDKDARSWVQQLKNRGIECNLPVYYPLHLYTEAPGFEKTLTAWGHTLSIPIYPSLSDGDADRVVESVNAVQKEIMRG